MNEERAQAAMPKLYGGPAYARPPVAVVNAVDRPFDPDDLPLESERTSEEHDLVQQLQAHPYQAVASTGTHQHGGDSQHKPRGRAFRLRLPGRWTG